MTGAPAENLVTRPVDSLEVRWILRGPLAAPMRDWFARFPARTETRDDLYLLWPRLPGLSVKLRGGTSLDVKSYLGSPDAPGLPVGGRLEYWRKWSFPSAAAEPADAAPAGWVTVRKQRRNSWLALAANQDPQAGCAVELTGVQAGGQDWWTVGFEATGPSGLLESALRHALGLVFARPLPPGIAFSLGNSMSYGQWLNLPPGQGGAG